MTQPTVQPGDVFVRSWGYDQTNVDYYEIVSVSKTGKTAKARKLKNAPAVIKPREPGQIPDAYGMSDRVTAATGPDRFVEDPRCARCGNYHRNEAGKLDSSAPGWDGHAFTDLFNWQARSDAVTVNHYGDKAWRWDGQPDYQTALGWGH